MRKIKKHSQRNTKKKYKRILKSKPELLSLDNTEIQKILDHKTYQDYLRNMKG